MEPNGTSLKSWRWILLALPNLGWAQGDTLDLDLLEINQKGDQASTLKLRPLISMDQALRELRPGQVLSRGPLGGDLWARGLGEQRIEVRVNGFPVHGACTDRMDPATIYMEPGQGQIILSPSSSPWSGGMGMGLDLQNSPADLADSGETWSSTSGGLGFSYPDFGRSTLAQYAYHGESTAYRVHFSYRGAENFHLPGNQVQAYSSFNKGNLGLDFTHAWNETQQIQGGLIYDREGYVGYPALPMDVGKAQALLAYLSWNWEDRQLRLFKNQVSHAMDDTHRDQVFMHMDMPGDAEVQGVQYQDLYSLGPWDLGLLYEYQNLWKKASMVMYTPGQSNMVLETWPSARMDRQQWGAKLERCLDQNSNHHLALSTDFSLAQSSLLSNLGQNQWKIFSAPTHSSDWGLRSGLELHSNWNQSWNSMVSTQWIQRIRSLEERYGYYLYRAGENRERLGNPWLGKEEMIASELDLGHRGTWDFSVKNWHRYFPRAPYFKILDSIPPMTPGAAAVLQEDLGSSSHQYGQEFELKTKWKNWEPSLGLDWMEGRDGSGHRPIYFSPLRWSVASSYHLGILWTKWSTQWNARTSEVRTDLGERASGPWNQSDFSLSLNWTHSQIALGMNNVFDQWILSSMQWGIPRPGRTFELNFHFLI